MILAIKKQEEKIVDVQLAPDGKTLEECLKLKDDFNSKNTEYKYEIIELDWVVSAVVEYLLKDNAISKQDAIDELNSIKSEIEELSMSARTLSSVVEEQIKRLNIKSE